MTEVVAMGGDMVVSGAAVAQYTAEVAERISRKYASHSGSLKVIALANGGVMFGVDLVRSLFMLVDFEVLCARSYTDNVSTHNVVITSPIPRVVGQHVLLVDDILDSGATIRHVGQQLLNAGAASICFAVFAVKKSTPGYRWGHNRITVQLPGDTVSGYYGVELPDKFVFGYGMDISGLCRNLLGIYAVKE